jgi:hypothetical protein
MTKKNINKIIKFRKKHGHYPPHILSGGDFWDDFKKGFISVFEAIGNFFNDHKTLFIKLLFELSVSLLVPELAGEMLFDAGMDIVQEVVTTAGNQVTSSQVTDYTKSIAKNPKFIVMLLKIKNDQNNIFKNGVNKYYYTGNPKMDVSQYPVLLKFIDAKSSIDLITPLSLEMDLTNFVYTITGNGVLYNGSNALDVVNPLLYQTTSTGNKVYPKTPYIPPKYNSSIPEEDNGYQKALDISTPEGQAYSNQLDSAPPEYKQAVNQRVAENYYGRTMNELNLKGFHYDAGGNAVDENGVTRIDMYGNLYSASGKPYIKSDSTIYRLLNNDYTNLEENAKDLKNKQAQAQDQHFKHEDMIIEAIAQYHQGKITEQDYNNIRYNIISPADQHKLLYGSGFRNRKKYKSK